MKSHSAKAKEWRDIIRKLYKFMNEFYYTQSLNLAAYLVMNGHELQGYRKNEYATTMYFIKTEELFKHLDQYNQDLKLKKFIASFKTLKSIINK